MNGSTLRRRFSRPLVWGGLAGVLLAGLVAAVAMAPRWSSAWVHEAVIEKASRRLELEVAIAEFDLQWRRLEVRGVEIGGGEDEPLLRFDRIAVELADSVLWTQRIVARDVVVEGGRVEGTRDQLETLLQRVVRRRADPPEEDAGRVRRVPEHVAMHAVEIAIREDSGTPRAVEGVLDVDADVPSKVASVVASDLRFDPGLGPVVTATRFETAVRVARTDAGLALAFPLTAHVEGLGAPVTPRIAVAGVDGTIEVADSALAEVALDLSGSFASEVGVGEPGAAKLWSASGRLRRDLSRGALSIDMESFELGRVPEVLEGLPLVDSADATVGGHVDMVFGGGLARIEGDVEVEGLNVDHRTLARTVVRDIGFEVSFAVEVDPRARRVAIEHASIERRGVKLELRGEIEHPVRKQGRHYRLRARVSPVSCQAVLEAIPHELVPGLAGFEVGGEFEFEMNLDVDFGDLENLVLDGEVGIWNCRTLASPAIASAEHLASGFTHRVVMRDGRERRVEMYSGSRSFTSLAQISPYMVSGVLTTEDGGFWRHRGFLPSQIRVALARNLAAGHIELGASTITMQMVKNVLLSHERTLSRKLQELFLTWHVESVLSKSRIMEIYLNAIEFGPGIYGVTAAASHYFDKHPADLTPVEAVYLTLMLPSPVRRHSYYCKDAISPGFRTKIQRILSIMHDKGRLTDFELLVWSQVDPYFNPARRASEAACLGEISGIMAGAHTQRARTGLLDHAEPRADPMPVASARTVDPKLIEDVVDDDDLYEELPPPPGGRVGVRDPDPAHADAPGVPAMDQWSESQ